MGCDLRIGSGNLSSLGYDVQCNSTQECLGHSNGQQPARKYRAILVHHARDVQALARVPKTDVLADAGSHVRFHHNAHS